MDLSQSSSPSTGISDADSRGWQISPLTLRQMSSLQDEFYEAVRAIENLANRLTPTEKLILRERIFHPNPTVYTSIVKQVSQSRSSVRRIQTRIERKLDDVIDPIKSIAKLLRSELAPIIEYSELDNRISSTLSYLLDPHKEKAESEDHDRRISSTLSCTPGEETLDFVKKIIIHHLGYSDDSNLCVKAQALELIEHLQDTANLIADDVGLINENTLKDQLPNNSWEEFWPMLLRCCYFVRIGEHLALRNNAGTQVKAALLTIGRPATKEEISSHCEIPLEKIGGHLSVIPSISRADKQRWGLAEWIDDEYKGISAKIIQRINEDGGATKLSRLMDELSRQFGVGKASVRVRASTSQFHIRDGYVSLANASSISLRHLDDVIEGYDKDGFPYWSFVVKNNYLKGYSLEGFPPELANALGCEPNKSIRVKIDKPLGCRNISISRPMTSYSGPNLGYLSDPLRKLEAVAPARVLMILKLPDSVEFRLARSSGESPAS